MIRESVVSSNIEKIGYDPERHELDVQFVPAAKTGEAAVWRYADVEPHEAQDLLESESIGRAFQRIKTTKAGRKIATIARDGVEVSLVDGAA